MTRRPPNLLFTPENNKEKPVSTRSIQTAFQKTIDSGVDLYFIKHLPGLNTTTIYLHLSGKRLAQVKSPIDLWKTEGR